MTIFKDKAASVATFKRKFAGVRAMGNVCKMAPDDVYAMLLAAENTVSERLGVLFEPTQVFCDDDDNTADMAALDADQNGLPYVSDPGYVYNPEFFRDKSWGFLALRRKPIIDIQYYRFVYITNNQSTFDVPRSWFRPDKKYGKIQLLPTGEVAMLPLNAYLLTVFGGSQNVPNMIRIKYTAGIKDINKEYPGLVAFIYRAAAMQGLLDSFPSDSTSISMDGLSQTDGFSIEKYVDAEKGIIEQEYRRWSDILNGVRMVIA